jgi:hypothetical protein
MFAALLILTRGYALAGHRIVSLGCANPLLVVLYCVWVLSVSQMIKRPRIAKTVVER